MPGIVRLGDICSGHGCWPSRENIQGSSNVFCNGQPVHRVGDAWAAHTCPAIPETHAGSAAAGSGSIFVNGRPVCRIGDAVDCGSIMVTGSNNVFAN